jgi:O-antigen/teichoic acid export membrane protein
VYSSAFLFYILTGLLVGLLVYLLAPVVIGFFAISPPSLAVEAVTALRVIGLYLATRMIVQVPGGTLGSFQRFDLANGLQSGEDILRTTFMIIVLNAGGGLVPLAWVIVGTTIARLVVGWLWRAALLPELSASREALDWTLTREMLRFARLSLGVTAVWLVVFNCEGIILGRIEGVAAAGIFAPAAQLMLYIRNIANTAAVPLTAAVALYDGRHAADAILHLYFKALRLVSALSFVACAGVVVFAEPFVRLWLPIDFAPAASVMTVLATGTLFFVPSIISHAVLTGLDRQGVIFRVIIVEAAVKISLGIWLVTEYGVVGMAVAASVPQIIIYGFVMPHVVATCLSIPVREIFARLIWPALPSGVIAASVGYLMNHAIAPSNWGALILNMLVCAGAGLACTYYLSRKELPSWRDLWPAA